MANIKNSKIFITGGAGFIATTLAKTLVDDNEIIAFDNLHNNALQHTDLGQHKNFTLVQGDILDVDSLKKAIPSDTDIIVHAAAIAGVDTVLSDPVRVLEVNIKGSFNVAEAASGISGIKKVVDFSTSEVFGAHAYNVDEFSINPKVSIGEARWTYSISKLAGEFIFHSHHTKSGLPTVTIRPFNIYGPNQVGCGAIHNFVRRALDNEPMTIHDDGSQIRSWCFVDDFVEGLSLCMEKDVAIGKSYNIGNPRSTVTVYNLAVLIRDIAGSSSEIEFKKMGYADVALRIPNIDRSRNDLAFEPQIELEEGLRRTIEWYRK